VVSCVLFLLFAIPWANDVYLKIKSKNDGHHNVPKLCTCISMVFN